MYLEHTGHAGGGAEPAGTGDGALRASRNPEPGTSLSDDAGTFFVMASIKRGSGSRGSGKKTEVIKKPTDEVVEAVESILKAIRALNLDEDDWSDENRRRQTPSIRVAKAALRYRQEQWTPLRSKDSKSKTQPTSLLDWLKPEGADEEEWFTDYLDRCMLEAESRAHDDAEDSVIRHDSRVLLGKLCRYLVPVFSQLSAPKPLVAALQRFQEDIADRPWRAELNRHADTKKEAAYRLLIPAVLEFLDRHKVARHRQTEFLECVLVDIGQGALRNRISKCRAKQPKVSGGHG